MMTGQILPAFARWRVRVQTRARQKPAGRGRARFAHDGFSAVFYSGAIVFRCAHRLLEACVNIGVIAGGVQIKAAVEVQRTIGLKAMTLARENNIYVGGAIEIFFYRARQSGFDMVRKAAPVSSGVR